MPDAQVKVGHPAGLRGLTVPHRDLKEILAHCQLMHCIRSNGCASPTASPADHINTQPWHPAGVPPPGLGASLATAGWIEACACSGRNSKSGGVEPFVGELASPAGGQGVSEADPKENPGHYGRATTGPLGLKLRPQGEGLDPDPDRARMASFLLTERSRGEPPRPRPEANAPPRLAAE